MAVYRLALYRPAVYRPAVYKLALGTLAVCTLLACGGGSATTTTTTPTETSIFGGSEWQTYESQPWGIRLSVPDPQRCRQDTNARGTGHIYCDYGNVRIEVFAVPRAMTISELRDYAITLSDVPPGYWRWEGERQNVNGYNFAEGWSASDNVNTLVGIAGHSGMRPVSHVVFIYGSNAVLSSHRPDIERFVSNIYAI